MNQLLELYKAIAQQEKLEKLEKERKKFAIRGKYITLTVFTAKLLPSKIT